MDESFWSPLGAQVVILFCFAMVFFLLFFPTIVSHLNILLSAVFLRECLVRVAITVMILT